MTVTNTLIDLLRQHIEVHSTVVWYDPEQHYLNLAQQLLPEAVAGATIQRYTPRRGFVGLRHDLEPLWAGQTHPPRLLIYVPRSQPDSYQALIEFEVAGIVVQPGQQPPQQNTAFVAVARQALGAVFPPARVEKICGEVEAGQWTVAGLDHLIEKGDELDAGVLAEIFGSGNTVDIVTCFLAEPELDAEIESRQALGNLAAFLSDTLDFSFPANQGSTGLRAHLARQLLLTELLVALGEHIPPSLKTFSLAGQPVARQSALELVQTWRNRRDLAESYVHWADQVQAEVGLGISSFDLPLPVLAQTGTFAHGETRLQVEIEDSLIQRATTDLVKLAEAHRDGFWANQKPEIKTRWEVILAAGRLLVEAARVESSLKGKSWSAENLLASYALGDQPWCAMDTAQRHLERDFHRFDLESQHQSLKALVVQARHRYASVSNTLAQRFTQAYADEKFEVKNVLLQADIYHEIVAPLAQTERVAYILVDALRYEMARELLTVLEPGWSHDLTLALATPPTITEVGMAALMPEAEKGLTLVPAEGNRLAVVVGGKTLKTRQNRLDHFAAAVSGQVVTTTLDQLAPLSDHHLSQSLKSAQVVLVTATEIDSIWENTPSWARRTMDEILNQLRRGMKSLFGLGLQRVVIAADHGYLFGEKLSSGQSIDPPRGHTATLKRRVWVGQGGADLPGTLRRPLSAFGLGGDLELVTPYNLACFKVKGGASEYFHGGLSLAEVVIPVLTVRSEIAPTAVAASPIRWALTLGSETISTAFISVTIAGQARGLFVEPPLVRVEVRAGDRPISTPISASYNFQPTTKDVQLEVEARAPQTIAKNTVTLQITEIPEVDVVTVHLLDATTGVTLEHLDNVPFSMMPF